MNTTCADFNRELLKCKDYLKRHSVSLTGDECKAKDLVQDTLYRALVNQEKFRPDTNMQAWLYTIMRNIFINDFKRRKSFSSMPTEQSCDLKSYKVRIYASNCGLTNMRLKELKWAIFLLPGIFKSAFELHFDGYKYNEIARMLGVPIGTVKSRIYFARKLLLEQIQSKEERLDKVMS